MLTRCPLNDHLRAARSLVRHAISTDVSIQRHNWSDSALSQKTECGLVAFGARFGYHFAERDVTNQKPVSIEHCKTCVMVKREMSLLVLYFCFYITLQTYIIIWVSSIFQVGHFGTGTVLPLYFIRRYIKKKFLSKC